VIFKAPNIAKDRDTIPKVNCLYWTFSAAHRAKRGNTSADLSMPSPFGI